MEASLADSHSAADFEMKVVQQVAEGSWVATHWGMEGVHHTRPTRDPIHKHMEPSGIQGRVAGITLHRVQDGKIAEGGHFENTLQYALETAALVHAAAAKK